MTSYASTQANQLSFAVQIFCMSLEENVLSLSIVYAALH